MLHYAGTVTLRNGRFAVYQTDQTSSNAANYQKVTLHDLAHLGVPLSLPSAKGYFLMMER